jgi:cytochrome c oxidase assembly factor CtaG
VSISPLPLAAAVVACVLFVRGFRRLRRRRPEYADWTRVALFGLAVACGLVALSSRLDELAEESLAAHMLQHLLLADIAPALALVALRGPLLTFVTPELLLRAVARSPRARATLSALTRPLVALAIWVVVLGLWHVPSVYDATLSSEALHLVEHLSFALAGTLVWLQIVDPARRRTLGTVQRLGLLLVMFTAGQMLAMTFVLIQRPLYDAYASAGDRLFGMSALGDQDAAGIVMMLEQMLVLGTAAAFLIRRHLAESSEAGAAAEAPIHPFAA